jgi:hypothetical protein
MIKRKFPRFPVEYPCVYATDNGSHSDGTAINLSRGGCAIRSSSPVERGDYLQLLIFPSPNQGHIEVVSAPVRWATREQFGVEFMTLQPTDVARLQGLLTSLGG